jgi:glycosyltransferase involved in cell wall biosynthesis
MLSIVIPTYNEEKYLSSLLDSIKEQDVKCEITVSDNNSKDKTREIARKYKCKIVQGGIPAKAKNNGAKKARCDLLFLDADVVLPEHFLKNFIRKINHLDYASCRVEPLSNNSHYKFYYMLKNLGNLIFPNHISGQCIYIKKRLFNQINGFDEFLLFGEEHDLVRRAKKFGKGELFMNLYVFNYPRRLEKEGTYRTLAKDIYSEIYRFFRSKRYPPYRKKYGHYSGKI